MTEESVEQLSKEDIEEARRYLELLHGDHLHTGFTTDGDGHLDKAAALRLALGVVESLEDGSFDTDRAKKVMDSEWDDEVSADDLIEISRIDRDSDKLVSSHPAIQRASVHRESRSYLQLLRDWIREVRR